MTVWYGWRYNALISTIAGAVGLTIYSVAVYPMMHLDEYKEIQKRNRMGIDQEAIQPGNMRVWSDPFKPKPNKQQSSESN